MDDLGCHKDGQYWIYRGKSLTQFLSSLEAETHWHMSQGLGSMALDLVTLLSIHVGPCARSGDFCYYYTFRNSWPEDFRWPFMLPSSAGQTTSHMTSEKSIDWLSCETHYRFSPRTRSCSAYSHREAILHYLPLISALYRQELVATSSILRARDPFCLGLSYPRFQLLGMTADHWKTSCETSFRSPRLKSLSIKHIPHVWSMISPWESWAVP